MFLTAASLTVADRLPQMLVLSTAATVSPIGRPSAQRPSAMPKAMRPYTVHSTASPPISRKRLVLQWPYRPVDKLKKFIYSGYPKMAKNIQFPKNHE
jgi:hypothetical protein